MTLDLPQALGAQHTIALLAQLISELGSATTTIGGCIDIHLRGDDAGSWSVDLDVPGGKWATSASGARDATAVFATTRALATLLLDPDAFQQNLRLGHVAVFGNTHRLTALGQALGRTASPMSVRAFGLGRTQKPGEEYDSAN